MELSGKTVLVMGATGVLGGLIATALANAGAIVLGTARTNDSAARLPASLAQSLLLDLEDAASVQTLATYLADRPEPLDAVVNAAGIVGFGTVEATTLADAARLMRVNHLAPAELISRILPRLAESAAAERQPVIVGITGIVSEQAFAGMAAYVASKTAHAAWLRALALEVRRSKVRVLDAHPGHTETGLSSRAVFGVAPNFPAGMTAEHVAQVILAAIISDETSLPSDRFAA
jgi:cyclic-di-GMP-binding biofilm dispersal mediator protein